MNGMGDFTKLTLKWQRFVNDELFKAIMAEFPFGTKMTKKSVATLLVDQSWIEKVQLYTWRSARASGLEISFEDFKTQLTKQKMYDGKVINSWKNSYEPNIGKKFALAVNNGVSHLGDRVKRLESGESDLSYVASVFKTVPTDSEGYKAINAKIKQLQSKVGVMSEYDMAKAKEEIELYIANNIKEVQYANLVKDKTQTVLNYQGKRLAQDQLQRANNEVMVTDIDVKSKEADKKEDLILVGYWTLSPTHKHHYYPGGDPCEKHANHNAGYGKGSYVGDIPVPVKDSHFGCKCKVSLKVEKKK